MKREATITGDRGYTVRVCYDLEAEAWDEALRQEGAAVERARILEAVEALRVSPTGPRDENAWQIGFRQSRNETVSAVLAAIEGEATE